MNEYGLWALPLILALFAIFSLYEVLWKGRHDREILRFLREEAAMAGDNPDEILQKLVMQYVSKNRHKQSEEVGNLLDQ